MLHLFRRSVQTPAVRLVRATSGVRMVRSLQPATSEWRTKVGVDVRNDLLFTFTSTCGIVRPRKPKIEQQHRYQLT